MGEKGGGGVVVDKALQIRGFSKDRKGTVLMSLEPIPKKKLEKSAHIWITAYGFFKPLCHV